MLLAVRSALLLLTPDHRLLCGDECDLLLCSVTVVTVCVQEEAPDSRMLV